MFAYAFPTRLALCSAMLVAVHASAQQNRPDIATHMAALGDKDAAVRWGSVVALANAGKEAVPALARALGDSDEEVRAHAALALGRIGPAALVALPDLITTLKDSCNRVRENAATAVGALGPDAGQAVGALYACLSDRDPYVNGASAEALSKFGNAAIPGLVNILKSVNATARWSATIALGKMGADASPAVSALSEALGDPSDEVRWGAAVALGKIGAAARSAVPRLLDCLSDRDEDVRRGASLALDLTDPSAAEAHTDWRSIAATIDTLAPHLMRDASVPGVAVALIHDRTLVWTGRYGVSNKKSGGLVTDETLFEACSMTKPLFGYLAMKLIELGKLDLDRPLVEYLEPSSLRGQPGHGRITARMVLSHMSGLPNWRKGDEERDGPLPVTFTPGSRFGYSGEGFYYLQRVVEQITGEPLDVYARRTLFGPLGLEHATLVWTEGLDAEIAAGHDSAGGFLQKSRYTHPNAAYTLYTSASDYARFLIEIMNPNGTLQCSLTQRSIDSMLAHHVAVASRDPIERPGRARGTAVYWGLGWSINATARGDINHHSGANRSGFRCFSQFDTAKGTGIVIMTNGTGGSDLWTRLISRIGNF